MEEASFENRVVKPASAPAMNGVGSSIKQCIWAPRTRVLFLLLLTWAGAMFLYYNNQSLVILTGAITNGSSLIHGMVAAVAKADQADQAVLNNECVFPKTNPFDPMQLRYAVKLPPLDCSSHTPNLVYVENLTIKVNVSKLSVALDRTGGMFKGCQYREIRRKPGSDKSVIKGPASAIFLDTMAVDPKYDDVIVECFFSNGTVMSRSYFSFVRVKAEKEETHRKYYEDHILKHKPQETLSVLIMGIDGMSKQNFERTMPKSRKFLLENLEGVELHKFNKLAYSTFPNVLGLLTGTDTNETHVPKNAWFDKFNHKFLWSTAQRLGYRTGLMVDQSQITAFHYLRRGFNSSPVDYYNRPVIVAWASDKLMRGKNANCVGDIPEMTQINNYWVQMAATFKDKKTPFFAFSFAARLTHDNCNKASQGDVMYSKFLHDLDLTGGLNNTVLVWFSDHGQRYGSLRSTFQGRIETNTPYMILVFPKWFKQKYPHLMKTISINQHRLTTHYDIHETLKDILYFNMTQENGTLRERGISLFREIPRERSCGNAGVPEAFCACAQFSQPKLPTTVRQQIGTTLLTRVNELAQSFPGKCVNLSLHSINTILQVSTNTLESMKAKSYRVVITASPGMGQFDGLVTLDNKSGRSQVVGEVVRSNLYRGQAECIDDPVLRQFCFCIHNDGEIIAR